MSTHPVTLRWRRGIWAIFCIVFAMMGLLHTGEILSFPALARPLPPQNPDDWLRLMLVRDWLAGGDIHSHAVARTNAPFGGISSHWTRLHDFVLAFFAKLMPAKTLDMKLLLAATWYPVGLAIAEGLLIVAAARRLFRHNHVIACALVLLMVGTSVTYYLKPGDADHHGLMSVLWCGVLFLLLDEPLEKARALLAGALLGAIIWVSPEGLLLLGGVLGLTGLLALTDQTGKRCLSLFAIAAGAFFMSGVGLLVEIPFAELLTRVTYDSLSVVHVAFLGLVTGGALFLNLLWPFAKTVQGRLYVAGAAGVSVMLLMYALYPKFFLGPMADADPFVFDVFLPMVSEAHSVFSKMNSDLWRMLMGPFMASLLLLAAFRGRLRPARRLKLVKLGGMFLFVFVLAGFQLRWCYYLEPVTIMIVAGLLPAVSARHKLLPAPRRWQPYLCIFAVFSVVMAATFLPHLLFQQRGGLTDSCLKEIRYVLQTQQLQKIFGDKDIVLYTMEDAGGEALFFTPYRIIASNYHREADGLKDMKAFREAESAEELRKLVKKRKVDAMLYCPAYHFPGQILYRIHGDKERPKWLMTVPGLRFFSADPNKPVLLMVKK